MASVPTDFPLSEWTLDRLLRRQAERAPDSPFLSFQGRDTQTYGEVWRSSKRLARGLATQGVGRNDRVAILTTNSLTAVHAWFGVNLLGATDAPINPAFRGQPLIHALNLLETSIIVAEDALLPVLREIEADIPKYTTLVHYANGAAGDLPAFERLKLVPLAALDADAAGWEPPGASYSDISSILLTSGTSGPSKGVMVPHAQTILIGRNAVESLRVTADDVFYCSHPLFHMSPRYCIIAAAAFAGAQVWIDGTFKAERWLDRVREAKATLTISHGPLLEMIYAQEPRPDDADNPLTRIGTAPFPKHIAADFEKRFGLKGRESWGMTEVGIPCSHPLDEPLRPGSCGKVLGDWFEVRVVDPDTDEERKPGEVGEIVVRPKLPWTLMQGYFGRPEATLAAWRNLWFHSGDSGYVDADGWFYFVDRVKDRIRRRAENISSYDIEVAAQKFDGVLECTAVGVPSEFAGDHDVKLSVVAAPGARIQPEALIAFLARALPHHMVPRYVEILEALPRTPTFKIQKSVLRQTGVTADTWDRKAAGVVLRALSRPDQA